MYIVIKKTDNKEYSLLNILQISLISMPFLSYIVSSFFYDSTEQCNKILTMSKLECSQMGNLKTSLKLFKLDNGNYPSAQEGLGALIINPNPKKYPNYSSGSYIERVPTDSYLEIVPLDFWKNPFRYNHYKIDGEEKFEIISFGADGKYGGEHDDIVYPDCTKKKVGFFEPLF
jgi:hypothetical protein